MFIATLERITRLAGLAAIIWFAVPQTGWAQQANCATCQPYAIYSCAPHCNSLHCPPAYKYCYEGAPRIHYQRGCPHPVCNPCELPNWGYHETCWTPWPHRADWSHCSTPPPAAYVNLNPYAQPNRLPQPASRPLALPPAVNPMPAGQPIDELPAPRSSPPPAEELPLPRPAGNRPL